MPEPIVALTLRIPPELHARLREAAAADARSINSACIAAIKDWTRKTLLRQRAQQPPD